MYPFGRIERAPEEKKQPDNLGEHGNIRKGLDLIIYRQPRQTIYGFFQTISSRLEEQTREKSENWKTLDVEMEFDSPGDKVPFPFASPLLSF